MTPENTLRYIATTWLFCAANCADQLGAAARETFGSVGLMVKPKPKPRRPRHALPPSWLQEHQEVEERQWPTK